MNNNKMIPDLLEILIHPAHACCDDTALDPTRAKGPALAQLEQLERELSGAIARAVCTHEEVRERLADARICFTNEST